MTLVNVGVDMLARVWDLLLEHIPDLTVCVRGKEKKGARRESFKYSYRFFIYLGSSCTGLWLEYQAVLAQVDLD